MATKRTYDTTDSSNSNSANKRSKLENFDSETSDSLKKRIWKLFDTGDTIPFLARYRKSLIGGLNPDQLRHVFEEYEVHREIQQKSEKLIQKLEKSGQLDSKLKQCISKVSSLDELESLSAPFKSTSKQSLVAKAKSFKGLEDTVHTFLKTDTSMPNLEKVKQQNQLGTQELHQNFEYILSDILLHTPEVLTFINEKMVHDSRIKIETSQSKESSTQDFKHYFNFEMSVKFMKPHQVLAINRGEKRKELCVKFNMPDVLQEDLKFFCIRLIKANGEKKKIIGQAITEVYKRLVKKQIQRRIRSNLTKKAEIEALDVFADNLRQLLMTPACKNAVILGLDPGFKHGCKFACIDNVQGNVIDTGVIYPRSIQGDWKLDAKDQNRLIQMVNENNVEIIGIGNRTGFREMERIIVNLIQKNVFNHKVTFTSVNEDGASIYSCSKEANKEFPNMDPNIVSAISIARRLQDPLCEYVKIGPSHLGVGMYQHDVSETKLAKTLENIVMECVSFVGVDLNQAPTFLLRHVTGISAKIAEKIVEKRHQFGGFRSRQDLLKIKGLGPKTFEQCAGFLNIFPGEEFESNLLDATLIHPESYELAEWLLTSQGFSTKDIGTQNLRNHFLNQIDIKAVKKAMVDENIYKHNDIDKGENNLDQVIEALQMELFADIRNSNPERKVNLKSELLSLKNLKIGMKLEGQIKNVTHFGVFVDIGIGKDALLHQSQFPKNNSGGKFKLGQSIQVVVKSIEQERQRVNLTAIC